MNCGLWIAYQTIVRKEVSRFSRVWLQTLIPPMVTTGLYFIIFGNLIGSKIGPMSGVDYVDFMMPGLILMSVIICSYTNVASSLFSAKFQRYIEEIAIAPIPNWLIILGYLSGGVIRGLLVGLLVLLVAVNFADCSCYSLLHAVLIAFLASLLFSLAGFINALYARNFDDISIIPTLLLTPLIYLGGVFYSINLLPPFWAQVSTVNPLLYLINTFRYGFIGVTDTSLLVSYVIIAVWFVVMFLWAMILLRFEKGFKI